MQVVSILRDRSRASIGRRLSSLGSTAGVQLIGLGTMLVGLLSIPGLIVFATWSELQQMKREWTIAGPPCPMVERPSRTAIGRKPPMTFTYGGAEFTRAFAAVSCVSIPEDGFSTRRENYRVCQFNNPGAVTVRYAGQRTVFEPPPGRTATVTIRHGRATCVVGGWFHLR